MGQRANFEEDYSGETLRGSYVAGVYYPDKTRVGWWKNGYPEYFAKVLNAPNWIGIHVSIDSQKLDLAKCKVENFKRVLDMRTGLLSRSFAATFADGKKVRVESRRFCSMAHGEIGAIRYAITPLNFSAKVTFSIYADADVVNEDANYDEKFWEEVSKEVNGPAAFLTLKTKKTGFEVCQAIRADELAAEGEAAVRAAFPRATIIRPSIVFGPEDQITNRFAAMARLPFTPVIASGTRFQPVYVRDLAEAIARSALEPETYGGKTFEIGGPQVLTMRELHAAVLEATGQSPEVVELPNFMASLIARFGWLPGAPLTRDQWLMLQRDNLPAKGAPGLEAFGIEPTPIGAVAQDLIAYSNVLKGGGQ